jgi:hypothetical protein
VRFMLMKHVSTGGRMRRGGAAPAVGSQSLESNQSARADNHPKEGK